MGKRLSVAGILAGGVLLGGLVLLHGQNKTAAPAPGYAAARMTVTVEARHGKEIPVLQPEDFSAYQGKVKLEVTDVTPARGADAGLQLFILFDDASAASVASQYGDVRQFIGAQPATTQIATGYMRNGTFVVTQDFTADHAKASGSLRLPLSSTGAMASPYLSVSELIKRWPGKPEAGMRREVVLVTSGVDPLGGLGSLNPYLDNAIRDAQRAGVIVYTIYTPEGGHSGHSYFRLNWAQNHLAQLAEETGGECYMLGFGAPVAFAPYLNEIGEHLANQYSVGFRVHAGKKADWEPVRFHTEVANADLVAAAKVYVPAAQ